MTEWWTYTLSDFLMFAPRTYWRQLALYNAAVWPLQLCTVAAGLALLAARAAGRGRRTLALALAAAWAWVAAGWHLEYYMTINWAAAWCAAAFGLQALLLAGYAACAPGPEAPPGRLPLALAAAGVAAYPWLGLAQGRPLAAAEVFALAPDPTVVATLGLVVPASPGWRAALAAVPLAWCAVGGATLWTMGDAAWWLLPLAGLLSLRAGPRTPDR